MLTLAPLIKAFSFNSLREIDENVFVISGSGISTKEDVVKAVELGMQGVGSSRAFVTANNPKKVLVEMASALMK